MAYHSGSDTFIINYTQAARWHQTLARGKAAGGAGSLMPLGCTGNHIDYHSCSFWINLHHPLAIFSIIFHLGRWMMEMLAAGVLPICNTAEIPSGDPTLSPAQWDRLLEGDTSLSLQSPSTLPHPPPLSPPWGSIDNIYSGWLKPLPDNTMAPV